MTHRSLLGPTVEIKEDKEFKMTRPTTTEMMYRSNLMLSLDHTGRVHIMKNRYDFNDHTEPASQEKVIKCFITMLTENQFGTRMENLKLFKDDLSNELQKVIDRFTGKEG